MKRLLVLLSLISLLTACGGKNDKKETSNEDVKKEVKKNSSVDLKNEIIGKWRNSNIKVTMKTDKGDSVLEANSKTWQDVMKIKPIVTTFKKNGSFKSVYQNLENEVIMTREGTWKIENDSLYMTQDDVTTSYQVKMKGRIAFFKGMLDWDQDGENDDLYFGRQAKIGKNKSDSAKKESTEKQ